MWPVRETNGFILLPEGNTNVHVHIISPYFESFSHTSCSLKSLTANTIMTILTNHFQQTRLALYLCNVHQFDWQTLFRLLWRWLNLLEGCQNVSHQQQFSSELPSPAQSYYYNYYTNCRLLCLLVLIFLSFSIWIVLQRFGTALVPWGQLHLKNKQYATDFEPINKDCGCWTCKHYTRAYINCLLGREEVACHLLTLHNIYYQVSYRGTVIYLLLQYR